MQDQAELLTRIVRALERLAPPAPPQTDWAAYPAYVWDGRSARGVPQMEALPPHLLRGIQPQVELVSTNVARLAAGEAAHDMLLWGSRGMGKSALLRSAVARCQAQGGDIALVQVGVDAVSNLPTLFRQLAGVERNFLIFVDDLGFSEGDAITPRHLRGWLDGGVEARPANVRLAVTSNRRAIVPRDAGEQGDPLNPRDALDDSLALADRFGLSIGFHSASQNDYLAMLRGYAEEYGLVLDESEALEWAKRRGARSGRVAWQFIIEIAGRAGKRL